MATKLTIQYKQEQRRDTKTTLVGQMECAVKVNGSAVGEHSTSRRFRRVFVLEKDAPGTRVEICAVIPAADGLTNPVMNVRQDFLILEESGTGGKASRQLRPIPYRHPRLRHSVNVGAGMGATFDLVVDTTFLNVTDYIKMGANVSKETRDSVNEFVGNLSAARPTRATSSLVVFEHTTLSAPPVWAMLLPPNWKTSSALANLFVYFRPSRVDAKYKNADNVPFDMFTRYCDYSRRNDKSIVRGHFHDGKDFEAFRRCCFEEQLALSGKDVILVSPLPQGADFGQLTTSELCKSGGILDKLLTALWAERLVGAGSKERPKLKRLALGGFSQGGVQCQKAFESNQEKVSELYLFDPGQGINASVVPWFQKDPQNRRLRMIGTAYAEESAMQRDAAIANWMRTEAISIAGLWTAKPGDGLYWYQNERYHQGLSHPSTGIDRFDSSTSPSPTQPASLESNLYVKEERITPRPGRPAECRVQVFGRWSGGTEERWISGNIGAVEAAVFARHRVILEDNQGHPVRDRAEFNKVVAGINTNDFNEEQAERSKVIRHEWAVVGGELRGGEYWGYLRWCLADSLFT